MNERMYARVLVCFYVTQAYVCIDVCVTLCKWVFMYVL